VIDVFVDELDLAELKFEAVVPQATELCGRLGDAVVRRRGEPAHQ
jgi:hypothetical protein